MSFVDDQKGAAAIRYVITGGSGFTDAGVIKYGGPSGMAPVGFNPALVREPLLRALQVLKGGQVNMGGLMASTSHGQAAYYVKLHWDAVDAYNAAMPGTLHDIRKQDWGLPAAAQAALSNVQEGFQPYAQELATKVAAEATAKSNRAKTLALAVVGAAATLAFVVTRRR